MVNLSSTLKGVVYVTLKLFLTLAASSLWLSTETVKENLEAALKDYKPSGFSAYPGLFTSAYKKAPATLSRVLGVLIIFK